MSRAKNLENNSNSCKLQKLQWSYYGLQGKYKQLQEKYNKLLKEKNDHDDISKFLAKTNTSDPLDTLRRDIVSNIIENDVKNPNGYRHNDNIYDFSRMMQNSNLKSYEILRQIIYLPSISSLDTRFSYDNNLLKESIQNLESIHSLLSNYCQIFDINDPLDCILAIDAASLDRPNKLSHSYVFTFYLQPIDHNYKCIPIHIHSKKNGHADATITKIVDDLVKILKENNINIISVATDGDDGYNSKTNETFLKYIEEFEKKGFQSAVDKIEKLNDILWLSDMLHIIKLARKYIIKGNVTVKSVLEKTFNSASLEEELNLGLPLTDKSSFSFMQDFYPLKIFDLKNLLTLYQKNMFDEYLYFLPFSLWIEAVTSPNLTKSTRLYFLKTAFHLFYYFYCQHQYFKFQLGITVYITKKSAGQFLGLDFIKRCMNTLIITYSIIKNYDNVALNRVGSHALENFFGLIRGYCKNFDDFENFIRCSIKAHENLVLRNKFHIQQIIKKRVNIAGEKINNNSGYIDFDENLCSEFNIFACALSDANIDPLKIFRYIYKSKDLYQNFFSLINEIISEKNRPPEKIKRPKITSGSHVKSRCVNAFYESKILDDE